MQLQDILCERYGLEDRADRRQKENAVYHGHRLELDPSETSDSGGILKPGL